MCVCLCTQLRQIKMETAIIMNIAAHLYFCVHMYVSVKSFNENTDALTSNMTNSR